MLSQVFTANKMLGAKILAASKDGDIEDSSKSKRVKLKIGKSESQKLLKSKKLSTSEN